MPGANLSMRCARGRLHEGRHSMPRMQQPPRQVPGLQDEELHRCMPGLQAQDVLQDGGVAVLPLI